MDMADGRNWLRKIRVPPAPVMNHSDAPHSESGRDLGSSHEVVEIHEPAHPATVGKRHLRPLFCVITTAVYSATVITHERSAMTADSQEPGRTITCEHIQIVDSYGSARIEIGNVAGATGGYTPGVELYDEFGAARLSMALIAGLGPCLSFIVGGNVVIEIRVDDPNSESGSGAAHLLLADGTGAPVVDVSVPHHPDGQWSTPP
jgi:hypothetical protein